MVDTMKRTIKDSVFTLLFSRPEYVMALYRALHPEDDTVTPEDFHALTLESALVSSLYNDFGVQVRDLLIILMEAQSRFSPNLALRILLYLAETYDRYVKAHELNLHSTLLRGDFYSVCTERWKTENSVKTIARILGNTVAVYRFLYESFLNDGERIQWRTNVEAVNQDRTFRQLSGEILTYAGASDLQGAFLRGADLQRAYLHSADLRGAVLQGADLQNANLRRANLFGANLQYAFLRGASLQGANLQDANLHRADLRYAVLEDADLRRAIGYNLEGTRGTPITD